MMLRNWAEYSLWWLWRRGKGGSIHVVDHSWSEFIAVPVHEANVCLGVEEIDRHQRWALLATWSRMGSS
jgi:hypothetical protein